MNKVQLIEKISEEVGFSRLETEKCLQQLNDLIIKTLKKGEKIVLTGFGTFWVSHRCQRKGRNPHTGAVISLAASRTPKFRAGKDFKETIKKSS